MTDEYRRMRHLKGPVADWATDDIVIGDGEITFEVGDDDVIRAKVGDGEKTFTNLPYLVDPLWSRVGTDIYTVQTGRVTIGSQNPRDRLSVMGGNYTAGVYRDSIPADDENLGGVSMGAYSAADTPNQGAGVRAKSVGAWSSTNYGAALHIFITPEGATSPVTAMVINDDSSVDFLGGRTRLSQSNPPASASAPGRPGDRAWDSDYEYRCVALDTWKRAPLSTW